MAESTKGTFPTRRVRQSSRLGSPVSVRSHQSETPARRTAEARGATEAPARAVRGRWASARLATPLERGCDCRRPLLPDEMRTGRGACGVGAPLESTVVPAGRGPAHRTPRPPSSRPPPPQRPQAAQPSPSPRAWPSRCPPRRRRPQPRARAPGGSRRAKRSCEAISSTSL